LKDKHELQNQERKVVIRTGVSSFSVGDKDSLTLGAGMILVRNAGGSDLLGMIPVISPQVSKTA